MTLKINRVRAVVTMPCQVHAKFHQRFLSFRANGQKKTPTETMQSVAMRWQ